ncbi:MAG: fumarylacetoacetate hydrolase family protein, partial [Actinomycetota bacterium]
ESELDPSDLRLITRVNREVRQDARTSELIFGIPRLISFISSYLTLLPGDVILTGTPSGIGTLAPGDRVEVEIEGIGVLEASVRTRSPSRDRAG